MSMISAMRPRVIEMTPLREKLAQNKKRGNHLVPAPLLG
jgi:hypothetical protein